MKKGFHKLNALLSNLPEAGSISRELKLDFFNAVLIGHLRTTADTQRSSPPIPKKKLLHQQ